MAEYTPSIPNVQVTSVITWQYNSGGGGVYTGTRTTGSQKTEVPLDAIPNGAEVTAVEYECTTSNSPAKLTTEFIMKKFDNSSGANLSNESIKTYLNGLNRQYSGESITLYYAAKAAYATASSSLGNLKVTFVTTLRITYIVYVYYGTGGEWVPCEIYYGADGEWHQTIPYFGVNGEWKQA